MRLSVSQALACYQQLGQMSWSGPGGVPSSPAVRSGIRGCLFLSFAHIKSGTHRALGDAPLFADSLQQRLG